MKTRVDTQEAILRLAAKEVLALVRQKPDARIALSAYQDCLTLYDVIRDEAASASIFAKARFFAVEEFEDLAPGAQKNCQHRLFEHFLSFADPQLHRSSFLTAAGMEMYDEQIAAGGGLDLVILGLGARGQIGLNEPATPYDSMTHRQKLTHPTKQAFADVFGEEASMDAYGLTIGVSGLVSARQIAVIALGEERAESVFRMLYARTDSIVPAAFLQLPPDVCIYLDKAAASKAFS